MTNKEKPGGAVEGAHPAHDLPARTSLSNVLYPATRFNARRAAKQLAHFSSASPKGVRLLCERGGLRKVRANHPACVLVPRCLWSSSIFHRVADEFGYLLHLWECDEGWRVELSHRPDVPAPTDIGVDALGPNFCTATPASKRRAIGLLWETQAQLNTAGLPHATIFLPMGGAWSS